MGWVASFQVVIDSKPTSLLLAFHPSSKGAEPSLVRRGRETETQTLAETYGQGWGAHLTPSTSSERGERIAQSQAWLKGMIQWSYRKGARELDASSSPVDSSGGGKRGSPW